MESISTWKIEVKDYNESLQNLLDNKSSKKDLYYGFEVIDGQLIEKPTILFIGINPGIGSGKYNRDIFETEQISYLDIFNEDYREDYPDKYYLAEKTIAFFADIGWEEKKIQKFFGNKVVKTNFYHLATKDVKALSAVLRDIDHKDKYFAKSAEFSISLIKVLRPKVVILEGKTVFQNIVKECYELDNWDNDKGFGYHHDQDNNVHIIGYKRRGNLTLDQRSQFIAKLKVILKDE